MGIIPSKLDRYSLMNRRLSHLMLQRSWTGVLISHLPIIAWQAPPCHCHDCHNQCGAFPEAVPASDCPKVKAAPYSWSPSYICIPWSRSSPHCQLRAHRLQAPELQLHPRTGNITGPEGAGDGVEDFSLEEERDTTMLRLMLKLRRKSLGVP